jgi:hypothetical protein
MARNKQPSPNERVACAITGQTVPVKQLVVLDHLRPALVERIRRDFPELRTDARISREQADHYRALYVQEVLREERGELTELERQVTESLARGELVTQNAEADYGETRTFGGLS